MLFHYKRFSLNKKLAMIPFAAIIPMLLLEVYLVVNLSHTTDAYSDITNNVVEANEYVLDFKERIDYTMYLSVIQNKTIDKMQVGKVTVNGILTVNPYEYVAQLEQVCDDLDEKTTVDSNHNQILRVKSTLNSLKNCIDDLENRIEKKNSYDENMQYLNNNIYVLTDLVQSGIQNYIYVETTNFEQVKATLDKNNRRNIWICAINAIAVGCISIVLSILAARSVTGPIRKLCTMTSKVAEGDFTAKMIRPESQDEIAVLANNFNHMTMEIGNLVEDMKHNHEMLRIIEMKLLQAQINPHFLYNTLDMAVWLAEAKQNDQVVMVLTYLSDFFRTTLSNGQSFVRIEEEKKHIESYLKIQQLRFQDILQYNISVDENLYDYIIPKLLLQPLIENALVHGLRNKRGEGHIEICGIREKENIIFYVKDDGKGMTAEEMEKLEQSLKSDEEMTKEKGFGVGNVNQRIHIYYGQEYGVFYESKPGKGTVAKIIIPAKNVSELSE